MVAVKQTGTTDDGSVRVAERNARAHADEFVHKEHTAFKHLFKNEHRAFHLRGDHGHNAGQVRRKSRPRRIVNFGNHTAQIGVHFQFLTHGYGQLVALNRPVDAQLAERHFERTQVFRANARNRD